MATELYLSFLSRGCISQSINTNYNNNYKEAAALEFILQTYNPKSQSLSEPLIQHPTAICLQSIESARLIDLRNSTDKSKQFKENWININHIETVRIINM